MKTEIVSTSAIAIANLSIGEVTDHLKQVCGDYATFASKGCKYIGLLRGQLVASGENPEDVFGLVKTALMKGGMEEKQAKSTTNNGKPHQDLAEFTLKGEGSILKESHFYGLSVENARLVMPFLRKGGDEAINALNKLKLDKSGRISSKALEKLLPAPTKSEPTPPKDPSKDGLMGIFDTKRGQWFQANGVKYDARYELSNRLRKKDKNGKTYLIFELTASDNGDKFYIVNDEPFVSDKTHHGYFYSLKAYNKFLVDFIDSEKPEPYKNPKTSLA
jgi:hypothetical protein